MRSMPLLFRSFALAIGIACAGAALADYVTFGSGWGSKWDDPVHGTPATVTWGFVPDGTAMDAGFPLAPEVVGTSNVTQLRTDFDAVYGAGAFDAALQRAFDTWHAVAGISFVGPVADPGLPMGAPAAIAPDIRVSAFAPLAGSGFSFVGAVGYGPPGDDLNFPDPVAGDIVFNLALPLIMPAGAEGDPIVEIGNDLENLFLHELGHAAMGLGHPDQGPGEVMYVGVNCCDLINREPSPDDIAGAQVVYGLSSIPACSNGIDDDGDGRADFDPVTHDDVPTFTAGVGDPGCKNANSVREDPQCQNGLNDDGKIGTDFDGGVSVLGAGNGDPKGADFQCTDQPWRNNEDATGCGLGFEVALLLFPLYTRWRRRR